MTNNINNITGVDVENLTAEEFFALVPQPPLTSSGYPLHFPSMDISSSDSDEEEEEASAAATGTNYYNDVSYLQNTGSSEEDEEEEDEDDEYEDISLYERKRYTSSNGVAVTHKKKYEEEEDIPMDISDSESEEEAKEVYKPVPLQRSVRCDGRLPFQELEEGEIDESRFGYQRQTAINSDGFSIENTMWEIDEIDLIALLESQLQVEEEESEDDEVQTVVAAVAVAEEVDYSDLPDLIPMEVCTEEYIMNHFNKRKRGNEE